jgi:hypothetical protein|tara:strand:- start:28 stop:921 length:894 start_codon:yes stop_codon:yes gene_type:complete
MGLGISAVQNFIELSNLGYFKDVKNILDMGAQELSLTNNELKELFKIGGFENETLENYPANHHPQRPRVPAKYFYNSLNINDCNNMDINGDHGALVHDLNKPFEDKNQFNKYDIVTDFGNNEHVFNIGECYRTMHNLTKAGGYMIIHQVVLNGNGYFNFDEGFFEGIAAANGYKTIYSSYVVRFPDKENISTHDFHIPRNKDLVNILDLSKLESLSIYGVLQKVKNEDFKIPYQDGLMRKTYNMTGGFNRVYLQNSMASVYVPSATISIQDARLKTILKALFDKIKLIIRIKTAKKK